jgi:hypothetical protein
MITGYNVCKQTSKEWEKPFELVDKQFVFNGTTLPDGSVMRIIEVGWIGEDLIAYKFEGPT